MGGSDRQPMVIDLGFNVKDVTGHVVKEDGEYYVDSEDGSGGQLVSPGDDVTFELKKGKKYRGTVSLNEFDRVCVVYQVVNVRRV